MRVFDLLWCNLRASGLSTRKRARVVEWAALEMRYTRKGIGGSNPPASARKASISMY